MSISLCNFSHIRPPHEHPQEKILEWIAKAHARAEKNVHPGTQEEVFYERIKERLLKIGLGPSKIAKRGTHKEVLEDNWEELSICPVSSTSKSSAVNMRSKYFDEAASQVFEQFYRSVEKLPSHLIHVTCTGYVAPSPAQKIVSQRNADCMVTNAYHMGCYASIPAIRMGLGFFSGALNGVDIVHTELCSLHMNPLFHSPEQLVVQSLFGDGFIKYSLTNNKDSPRLEIKAVHEQIIPNSLEDMSWWAEEGGMKMTLSRDVPAVIAEALPSFFATLVKKADLSEDKIKSEALFAIHPGGPKIIDQIKEILALKEHQIEYSTEVLKSFGNMSSATLPHIWEKMLNDRKVMNGSYIVSMAFGPGLTICGTLFEVKGK